jgi:hypothetical protein
MISPCPDDFKNDGAYHAGRMVPIAFNRRYPRHSAAREMRQPGIRRQMIYVWMSGGFWGLRK